MKITNGNKIKEIFLANKFGQCGINRDMLSSKLTGLRKKGDFHVFKGHLGGSLCLNKTAQSTLQFGVACSHR